MVLKNKEVSRHHFRTDAVVPVMRIRGSNSILELLQYSKLKPKTRESIEFELEAFY